MINFVARKSSGQMRHLAAGVAGPARERLIEIDIEHDTAEIEQQRVGGAGGRGGRFIAAVYENLGKGATVYRCPFWRNLPQCGTSGEVQKYRRRLKQLDCV